MAYGIAGESVRIAGMSMSPPPFSPSEMPAARKSSSSLRVVLLILFLVCVPCIGLVAVGGYFGFNLFGKGMKMASCAIAFEDVRDAMMTYANEHDGKLPNAKTWQTDIKDYYGKVIATHKDMGPIKIMPISGPWGCDNGDEMHTGMAFNSALSGKKLKDIENPYGTVLLFEIEKPALNASAVFEPKPKSTGPMFFGSHRPWMTIPVQGQSNFGKNGSMRVDVETSKGSDTGAKSSKESNTTD